MNPDPIDTAQEQADAFVAEAIRNASAARPKRLPESPGFCDYCGIPTLSDDHLFCNLACSTADEREKRQRALNRK